MNYNYDCAIFDLDGTLLDSMDVWYEVDRAFFAARGLELTDDYQEKIKSMYYKTAAKYTVERFDLPETAEEVAAEWHRLSEEEYRNNVCLKEGARELLLLLKERGVKLAFATALLPRLAELALRRCGVYELFTAQAYLSEVDKSKESPDVYLLAAQRAGCKPEKCIVFEDVLEAVRGAKSGNFAVCAVYDSHSAQHRTAMEKEADMYIESFSALRRAIE